MVQSSREELVGFFFQEVQTYIPEIKRGLSLLRTGDGELQVISEIHRLFHNIKGAASQVYLQYLSAAAQLAEFILDQTMEEGTALSPALISYLDETVDKICDYCSQDKRNSAAESDLLRARLLAFKELYMQHNDTTGISLYKDIAQRLEEDLVNPVGLPGQDSSEALSEVGHGGAVVLNSIVRRLQQLVGFLQLEISAGREGYGKILLEMQRAVAEIADRAEELEMSVEGDLLRDLEGLLGKARNTDLAPHQDISVMLGYFVSLLSMQIESMLLRYLDGVAVNTSIADVVVRQDISTLLKDFVMSYKILFADPAVIDERSATRISERISRIESLLMASDTKFPFVVEEDVLPNAAPFSITDFEDDGMAETFVDQLLDDSFAEIGGLETWTEGSGSLLVDEAFSESEDSTEENALHEIFREECEDHLVVISRTLNSLEERINDRMVLSTDLREILSAMRRAVHTLKGAAAMVGYEQLAACAHSLEDMLDWLYDHAGHIGPDDLRIIASAIDLIEILAQQPCSDNTSRIAWQQQTIAGYLEKNHVSSPAVSEDPKSLNLEHTESANFIELDNMPGIRADAEEPDDAAADKEDTSLSPLSGNIRVKIENLDEIISIEGELIVARSSMEGILNELQLSVDELNSAQNKLRRISQELEAGFEVQSLYGFGTETLAGQETTGRKGGGEFNEFDPIELDRYSQLNLIIRSLNELSVDVNSIHAGMAGLSSELHGQIAKQQLIMGAMQDKLMRTRMTPMSAISRAFFRTVRNTAGQLKKNVRLTVTGDDVFMDRFIWSKISDPLMHILRNCVDHGIESATVRREKGKPEIASIRIEAQQLGSFVAIRIADDGAGIDTAHLREKLIAAGLVNKTDTLTDEDLLPYLFKTGFSTKDVISHISGRGVGLDVVQKNIQELRGAVHVETQPGQGTAFELRIPITLSVNRAILIAAADSHFAIPLQDVMEIRSVSRSEISQDGLHLQWKEEALPVKDLAAILKLREPLALQTSAAGNFLTLIVRGGKGHVAVLVDAVKEQREIVVKNLGTHLTHVTGVSGVTILGDGSLIPVLNLSELVDESLPVLPGAVQTLQSINRETPLQILIVDDSISVRQSIARLVKHQSWRPEMAVDGVDALEKLETFYPDAIILDIEMPRMNGFEFMSILRKTENIRAIPVIMLTSRNSDKHRTKADELGVDFYMTKPFQDEAFVQLLGGIRQYRRPQ